MKINLSDINGIGRDNCSNVKNILVTGCAGFIGSYLVDTLLANNYRVIGIDNLVRGNMGNLVQAIHNENFLFSEFNLTNQDKYRSYIHECINEYGSIDMVWHMAANSDIAAGVANPDIDFKDTFLTTYNTLKVMQEYEIKKIAFASSSAIYGVHNIPIYEDIGPIMPISNYGAMKLASEGIISAAVESFLDSAYIFRFPNVIGARATHGVIYDFMHKLKMTPNNLEVLGDGNQQKPYLHVSELIEAMFFIWKNSKEKLSYFNIGAPDSGVTVHNIARMVVEQVFPAATISFTGGDRGWVGDVPKFEYSLAKLKKLGWEPKLNSEQAIQLAIKEIAAEIFTC